MSKYTEDELKMAKLFLRFIKEEGTYYLWIKHFKHYNTFYETIKSCFNNECYSTKHMVINKDHTKRFGVPHNVYSNIKKFSVDEIYAYIETNASISANKFRFICSREF